MKFLVVGLIKSSQIQRLKEEAEKIGHEVYGCKTSELVIKSGDNKFEPCLGDIKLTDFDLIYLCAGIESKKRYEWYIACDYLANYTNVQIVNDTVLDPGQKYYPIQTWFYLKQYEHKIPQPPTYTVYKDSDVDDISKDLGYPMIVKLSETHQGKGVFLANSSKEVREIMTKNASEIFLLRKLIPNDGDIRVFVVGGRAIGAMKRTPAQGEFRSNISIGGKGETFDLDANLNIKQLAEKSAEISGVEIAGVDIIINKETGEPLVLEINIGPQFKGLEKYTKVNAGGEIVKYFESKCERKSY